VVVDPTASPRCAAHRWTRWPRRDAWWWIRWPRRDALHVDGFHRPHRDALHTDGLIGVPQARGRTAEGGGRAVGRDAPRTQALHG
jgi:hypothetical protein